MGIYEDFLFLDQQKATPNSTYVYYLLYIDLNLSEGIQRVEMENPFVISSSALRAHRCDFQKEMEDLLIILA